MANNDGTISEQAEHTAISGDARTAHLKDLTQSPDRLMTHLVEVNGVKNVPVSKAQQAKAHAALHPAPAPTPAPEPTPAPAPAEDAPVEGPLTELDALKAELAALKAARPAKAATFGTPEAKNELFRAAVKVLDELVAGLKDDDPIVKVLGREEAARTVSQAIHHFATGKDSQGVRVWPATTLPKPNRSSWK